MKSLILALALVLTAISVNAQPEPVPVVPDVQTIVDTTVFDVDTLINLDSGEPMIGLGADIVKYKGFLGLRLEIANDLDSLTMYGLGVSLDIVELIKLAGDVEQIMAIHPKVGLILMSDINAGKYDAEPMFMISVISKEF